MRMVTRLTLALVVWATVAAAQTRDVALNLDLNDRTGPLEINHFALAQGGLTEEPLWTDRVPEVKALNPALIRFFAQPYFDVLPAPNTYDWRKLDETVDLIHRTGAEPLMDITLKPKLLYPKIDPKVVYPNDWKQWDDLIFNMARHYKGRIHYWEIGDECEIGEDSGCAYECTPENYSVYYQHTAEAIMQADPEAHVGGPTIASYNHPLLPYFLNYVETHKLPLHFVSWHVYS